MPGEQVTLGMTTTLSPLHDAQAGDAVIIECGGARLELRQNGDIYVNGRLAANDIEVVSGLREIVEYHRISQVQNS